MHIQNHRGNDNLNTVLKFNSLYYGSECTTRKDQQVLPVLEEFTGFLHPKIIYLLFLTYQINGRLLSSVKSVTDWVFFKYMVFSGIIWKRSGWVNLTFAIAPFHPETSTSAYFPFLQQSSDVVVLCCCSCCFLMHWKNLIGRTIVASIEWDFLSVCYMYVKWM